MTINSTPHQIETVFGTQYFIDFYQRDYKWTQPQVEAVLDDIFFKFDADYHPEHDAFWKGRSENFQALACEPIYAFQDGKESRITLS